MIDVKENRKHRSESLCREEDILSQMIHETMEIMTSLCGSVCIRRQLKKDTHQTLFSLINKNIVIVILIILLLPNFVCSANNQSSRQINTTSTPKPSPSRVLSSRVVKTKYGSLKGELVSLKYERRFFESSLSNNSLNQVEVFLGIPYASPPVGSLRWMPPTTTSLHWKTTRLFNQLKSECPQILPKNVKNKFLNQSEDCLYLNIYAPFKQENNGKFAGSCLTS